MNIVVDNMLVRYTRQGSGKPVVLLHGWADRLETFDDIANQLADKYEVIRLDLAGFGSSQPPTEAWGLDDYARQVEAFLIKIKVIPYAIIGHSNGGAVAIKGIASNKLAAEKLVLIASAGIRNDQKTRKTAWLLIAKAGKLATLGLPKATRSRLRSRLYQLAGSDMMVSPQMEATFKRTVNEDVLLDAKNITAPTLVINGTNDTATPPAYAKQYNGAIHGSRLEMIDGADHFVHQRYARQVGDLIEEFLG